jgi:hypothetical protein
LFEIREKRSIKWELAEIERSKYLWSSPLALIDNPYLHMIGLYDWINREEVRLIQFNISEGIISDPTGIMNFNNLHKIVEYDDLVIFENDFDQLHRQISKLSSSDLKYPDKYISSRLLKPIKKDMESNCKFTTKIVHYSL